MVPTILKKNKTSPLGIKGIVNGSSGDISTVNKAQQTVLIVNIRVLSWMRIFGNLKIYCIVYRLIYPSNTWQINRFLQHLLVVICSHLWFLTKIIWHCSLKIILFYCHSRLCSVHWTPISWLLCLCRSKHLCWVNHTTPSGGQTM